MSPMQTKNRNSSLPHQGGAVILNQIQTPDSIMRRDEFGPE
jgi:hypothetical protein